VRRADNLTTFMCRLSGHLGALASWNPQGLSRPVMGLLLQPLNVIQVLLFCTHFKQLLVYWNTGNRRHSWIGHTIRHNEFVVNMLEGAISGKKAVGRPRLQYLKQVARNTADDSYTAVDRTACNSSRWKAANQSKD